MSGTLKSIAMSVGVIIAMISLALVPPTAAIGKENRRSPRISARIHGHAVTRKRSTINPARSAIHPSASGKSNRDRGAGIVDDPFFFDVGVVKSPAGSRSHSGGSKSHTRHKE